MVIYSDEISIRVCTGLNGSEYIAALLPVGNGHWLGLVGIACTLPDIVHTTTTFAFVCACAPVSHTQVYLRYVVRQQNLCDLTMLYVRPWFGFQRTAPFSLSFAVTRNAASNHLLFLVHSPSSQSFFTPTTTCNHQLTKPCMLAVHT